MKKNTRDYQMIAEKFLYVSIITNYPFVLIERYPDIQQSCLFNKIKCLRNWKIIFVNELYGTVQIKLFGGRDVKEKC